MNRPVIFRPAAEHELLEAERWFEERQPELGQRFRDSVDSTVERIRQFPLAFPVVHEPKGAPSFLAFPTRSTLRSSTRPSWSLESSTVTGIPQFGNPGVEA